MPLTADTDDKVEQSKWILSADDAMVLFSVEEQQVSLVLKADRVMVSTVRGEKTTGNRDCCSVKSTKAPTLGCEIFPGSEGIKCLLFQRSMFKA